MQIPRPPLTFLILAFVSSLLLFAWLLFAILAFNTSRSNLYSQKAAHAKMLLSSFVQQLPEAMPQMPYGMLDAGSQASVFASNISSDASFLRLTLLDTNGKSLFTVGKDAVDSFKPFINMNASGKVEDCSYSGDEMSCFLKIRQVTDSYAAAGITVSLADERNRLEKTQRLFMAYFAIDFVLLLGFGSFMLSRMVVNPLKRLISATEKIISGHYGLKITVAGGEEIALLAETFNKMSTTLKDKDEALNGHIEALKNINNELIKAKEENIRTEKMASIGVLAAGMAHEIGTPLASIVGYADMMANEDIDMATAKEYAKRICSDTTRIDRIVRGLLEYAKPRKKIVEVCDINELIRETLHLMAEQGISKYIDISEELADGLPKTSVDPYQMQQVFINFIINSRDAMPDGGKLTIKSCLANFEGRSFVEVDFADSGCGIAKEYIQHIFDPFFTTKEPGKGTGLGLAISARIVESFGGRIVVESEEGNGALFKLYLPSAAA